MKVLFVFVVPFVNIYIEDYEIKKLYFTTLSFRDVCDRIGRGFAC